MTLLRFAIGLCAAVVLSACATPDAPVGSEQTEKTRPLCPADNLDRCLVLGLMLESGYQGKPDPKRASSYYTYACERGQNEACYNLAVMEVEGRGVVENVQSARTRYGKICDDGHANGCANLGYLVSKGLGGAADESAASDLYRRACENGSAVGCANLADKLLAAGKVVPAIEGFRRACRLGNVSACVRHGWSKATDCGAESCDLSDETALATMTRTACKDSGDARVCATYAAHLLGGTHFERSPKEAGKISRKACDEGDGWACAIHASLNSKGAIGSADHDAARISYRRGCDAKFAPACTAGGVQLIEGRGVERDTEAGYAMLAEGCSGGDGNACNTLLLICQQGDSSACQAQ